MRDKLIFLILFLFMAQPVWATKQFLMGGSSGNPDSTTRYNGISGGPGNGNGGWATNELIRTTLISSAGTLSNLRVEIEGSVSAGDTRTFTIRINQAASSLACTITDSSSNACTDTGDLSVSTGDRLSIETSQTGTCCENDVSWSLLFDSTDTGATILMGGSAADSSVSQGNDFTLHGVKQGDTSAADVQTLFPLAGTLKNFYVRSENIIGVGNTLVFRVEDSAGSGTGITCTLTNGGGNTCNDTVNTQAVVAGERYSIEVSVSGTADTHGALFWGIELTAITEGQFGVYHSDDDATQATNTEYAWTQQTNFTWTTTATDPDNQVGQAATIQAAYVHWVGTNGAGDSMTFTLESDGATGTFSDSDIVIVLSEAENTGNDSGTINGVDDELYRLKYVPVTPDANGDVRYAFRAFIDPGVAVITTTLHTTTMHGVAIN